MVSDTVEGLQWMLKDLERYAEENRMEVNAKKTKIMVCRNGGTRMKGESWTSYKGEELESVSEYKYLGYWFNCRGSNDTQVRKLQERSRKVINKAIKVNTLRRRMLLMNALAKAGGLYGVEVWGSRNG